MSGMKKTFYFMLVALISCTTFKKKCPVCGRPILKCEYKGEHPINDTLNGHEWANLGLLSGTKWATMNVGANSPADYGYYYAWGETCTKNNYTWENLKYWTSGDGLHNIRFSKYIRDSEHGKVDNKKELEICDDVANASWGPGWRVPSEAQQNELLKKCKWVWTSIDGHDGYKVIGPNGNSIFIPAAGYCEDNKLYDVGSYGYYWSRSLEMDYSAYNFFINSDDIDIFSEDRRRGCTVRPVVTP